MVCQFSGGWKMLNYELNIQTNGGTQPHLKLPHLSSPLGRYSGVVLHVGWLWHGDMVRQYGNANDELNIQTSSGTQSHWKLPHFSCESSHFSGGYFLDGTGENLKSQCYTQSGVVWVLEDACEVSRAPGGWCLSRPGENCCYQPDESTSVSLEPETVSRVYEIFKENGYKKEAVEMYLLPQFLS